MVITHRRRVAYTIAIGLDCAIVYSLIFPIPYTSPIHYPIVTALFAVGALVGWRWLGTKVAEHQVIDLTHRAVISHELIDSPTTAELV